jgi:hypothetical protein
MCYIVLMKAKLLLANFLYWIHVAIVLSWVGLFFVPISVWHDRIAFHFYLTLLIVGHQFIWGSIIMPWTKKFRMVCVLTTFMQLLRGQSISDPENYEHSWFKEFAGKQGIKIPHAASTLLAFSILALTTYQFFFLQ